MDRTFLVSLNNNIYCGKCGEQLFNDSREISKHLKKCNAVANSEAKTLEEIKSFSLEAKKNSLLLTIFQATGNPVDFKGIIWEPIYFCEFFNKNKVYKEQGTENLAFWIDMLELNMLFDKAVSSEDFNISNEPSFITINKVFHGVGYINSISDFIKRFLTKGFKNKSIDTSIFRKIQPQRLDLNIGKKYNNQIINFCQLKEIEINNDIFFACCCVTGEVKEGKINVESKNNIYITHNYIYNPNNFDIYNFINKDILYGRFRYDKFSQKYPNVMFKEYINSGGQKYLNFLMAENNDFIMELTGKSSLGYISNKLSVLTTINKEKTTVKDIFGLPVKALRNINTPEICEELDDNTLKMLQRTYSLQPAIFSSKLTKIELKFLNAKIGYKGNDIYACKKDPKDILDYCRYCKQLNDEEYILFVDYSNMCNNAKLWPYKKFPEPSKLKEAHDVIMHYLSEKRKADQAQNFEIAVNSEKYFNLINIPTTIFYKESKLTLLKPRSAQDLVEESYQMRNCVRSYVPAVANHRTYILFLRHKASKSKSFVTVEINNNLELVQVKGKCNTPPTQEVKEWITNYCKDKGIDYSNCYDLKEKYSWW